MTQLETVLAFFAAIEQGKWEELRELVTKDFTFKENPLSTSDIDLWISHQKAFQKAFPDWAYNVTPLSSEDKQETVLLQITGTHTGEFNLPMQSWEPIPPTNRSISLPQETTLVTVEDGKIKEVWVQETLGGGVEGILDQLKGD